MNEPVQDSVGWLDHMAQGVSNMKKPRFDNNYGRAAQIITDLTKDKAGLVEERVLLRSVSDSAAEFRRLEQKSLPSDEAYLDMVQALEYLKQRDLSPGKGENYD